MSTTNSDLLWLKNKSNKKGVALKKRPQMEKYLLQLESVSVMIAMNITRILV